MPGRRFVSPPAYKTRGFLLVRWTCKPLHCGAIMKKSHLCFSNQKYIFNYTMYAWGKCDYCMYQHIILYHLFYINFFLVLWLSSQSEATTQALRLRNSKLGCGAHFTQQRVNNDTVDRKANNCAHTWQKKEKSYPTTKSSQSECICSKWLNEKRGAGTFSCMHTGTPKHDTLHLFGPNAYVPDKD